MASVCVRQRGVGESKQPPHSHSPRTDGGAGSGFLVPSPFSSHCPVRHELEMRGRDAAVFPGCPLTQWVVGGPVLFGGSCAKFILARCDGNMLKG